MAEGGIKTLGGVYLIPNDPRQILRVCHEILGYVSRCLRVVLRAPTMDAVAEPCRAQDVQHAQAKSCAAALLGQINVSERPWLLSPTSFSGGDQPRVNSARGCAHACPALLRHVPTASLEAHNRDMVLSLTETAKGRGESMDGISLNAAARDRVCDREVDVRRFVAGVAA